jgi:V-type H+-transporting ATPase subunit E
MSSQEFKGVSLADYVIQEAKEKSFEIEIKTLKQFEKEKNAIVAVVKDKIKEDYE